MQVFLFLKIQNLSSSGVIFLKAFILFIWLCWVLVTACELLVEICGIQFPDQGVKPVSPALGAQSLNHGTVSASVSMGSDARRQSEGVRGVAGKWEAVQGGTLSRGLLWVTRAQSCWEPVTDHVGSI